MRAFIQTINAFFSRDLETCRFDQSSFLNKCQLFLISFLVLYFELFSIRWLSTEIRYFAYFKNFPLISAFVGLGVGCALARRRTYFFPLFPYLISLFIIFALLSSDYLMTLMVNVSHAEDAIVWTLPKSKTLIQSVTFYALFVLIFFLNMGLFTCMGQLMGRLMLPFKPLTAYSINIFGSLIGILAFSVFSLFSVSPFYWFIFGFVLLLWFVRNNRIVLVTSAIMGVIALTVIHESDDEDAIWSPYYKLTVAPFDLPLDEDSSKNPHWGYRISVNGDNHQSMLNLSHEYTTRYSDYFPLPQYGFISRHAQTYYNLPYRVVDPKSVLIVGGGSGNDAAAALRNGVTDIDVVEIDPQIINLGKKLHPEKPYDSPHVHIYINDARSFFKKCKKRYDLIVFGFLDSQTLFANISSVRLDNFVYTVESMEDSRRLLNDQGTVFLSFALLRGINDWTAPRIFNMLEKAYGKEPIALFQGRAFFTGPGVGMANFQRDHWLRQIVVEAAASFEEDPVLVTDDWPFLFLKTKSIPRTYWIAFLIIGLLFWFLIKPGIFRKNRINYHFFFLGCSFLLLETRSLIEMALLLGSTWVVNSFVFSAILILILFANWIVGRFPPISLKVSYGLLSIALLANYFIPFQAMLGQHFVVKSIVLSLVICLPLFFAAIIFATSFKETRHVDIAIGSNLVGALLGGFLEYSSLLWGTKSLCLIALAMYLVSFYFVKRNTAAA